MRTRPTRPKRLIVVGGGFGGLEVARRLAGEAIELTLIDRRESQVLYPLLYQVASGRLRPGDVEVPIRRALRRTRNARSLRAEVTRVDLSHRWVQLASGSRVRYDYLVLAAGAEPAHTDPHSDPASRLNRPALALEDAAGAAEVHRQLRRALLRSSTRHEGPARPGPARCIIVGAGPIGVELAAALATIRRRSDEQPLELLLLESSDRVLPAYRLSASRHARARLDAGGVRVRTGIRAQAVGATTVVCGDERLDADVICWAGGTRPARLAFRCDTERDSLGRVIVQGDCSLPRHPEVFVIGDMARPRVDPRDPPMKTLAAVAVHQGRCVAANVRRDLRGAPRHALALPSTPQFAVVGRHQAVAELGDWQLHGPSAWWLRSLVHGSGIVGFRRQAQLLVSALRPRARRADAAVAGRDDALATVAARASDSAPARPGRAAADGGVGLSTSGHLIERVPLDVGGTHWSVALLMTDHAHHLRIEREGDVTFEHVGSIPEDWPGAEIPPEVRKAVASLRERMSWS